MKKRIFAALMVVILAFCLIGFTGSEYLKAEAAQTFEKVDFINGVVIVSKLNLRNGPSLEHDVIGQFKQHKWLNVLAKIGDWYAVFDPESGKVGCVYGPYLANPDTINKQAGKTAAPSPSPKETPPASPAPGKEKEADDLSQQEKQLLDLINQERAKSNLSPLIADPELMKVARTKADDMTKNNYFSHYSPTYGSPFDMMRQFGISFKAAAENIAGNSTVEGAVNSWMKSEGHRNNIMNPNYNYTGIGISRSTKYGYVFVQMFIRR